MSASDIVEALVLEYLKSQHLTSIYEAFSKEKPRHEGSIRKRELLYQSLGLERFARKREKRGSTLELWVEYQLHTLRAIARKEESQSQGLESGEVPASSRQSSFASSPRIRTEDSSLSRPNIQDPLSLALRTRPAAGFPGENANASSETSSSARVRRAAANGDSPGLSNSGIRQQIPRNSSQADESESGSGSRSAHSTWESSVLNGYADSKTQMQSNMSRPASQRANLRSRPPAQEIVLENSSSDEEEAAATSRHGARASTWQPPGSNSAAPRAFSHASKKGWDDSLAPVNAGIAGMEMDACIRAAGGPSVGRRGFGSAGAGAGVDDDDDDDDEGLVSAAASRPIHRPSAAPRLAKNSDAAARSATAFGKASTAVERVFPTRTRADDLEIEELDEDLDLGLDQRAVVGPRGLSSAATQLPEGLPVSAEVTRRTQQLLWGTTGQPPNSFKQGLFFRSGSGAVPGLEFGLLQVEGGPCGVLAALQAHLFAALGAAESQDLNLRPSPSERQAAVVAAVTAMLWQAGDGYEASVAVPPRRADLAAEPYSELCRGLRVVSANSKADLQALVSRLMPALEHRQGWGIVLLMHSLVLCAGGPERVASDMDERGSSFIGAHGYCTQELVNLFLIGRAITNVFDGERDISSGQDTMVLRGVAKQARIGFLTLFEWYKCMEVGMFLKRPKLPIWVVCSESHFTVLAAPTARDGARALGDKPPFDLIYYDMLAQQQAPIRLTIRNHTDGSCTDRVAREFTSRGEAAGVGSAPPLELVIKTRWPGVSVDWNGSETIL